MGSRVAPSEEADSSFDLAYENTVFVTFYDLHWLFIFLCFFLVRLLFQLLFQVFA
jgi:hypothetical protein